MLKIVVPPPESELRDVIWPASGIMASQEGDTGRLRLDYDGNQDIYPTYADRVGRAASRHIWAREHRSGYPTQASAHAAPDAVRTVRSFDPGIGQLTITDADVLADWLGLDHVPNSELRLTTES